MASSNAGQDVHAGQHGEAQALQNRKPDELQAAFAMSMLSSGTAHVAQLNGGGEVSKSDVDKPTRKRKGSSNSKKQKKGKEVLQLQAGKQVSDVRYNVGNIGPHNSSRDAKNPNMLLIDPAALQAQVIAASKSAPGEDLEHRSGNAVNIMKEKTVTVQVSEDMGEDKEPKKHSKRTSKSKTVAEMLKTQTKSSGRRKKSSESADTEIVTKPKSPRSPRRKSPERMYASKDDNNLPPKKRKLAYFRVHDQRSPVGDSAEVPDANAKRPSVVVHTSGTISPDKKISGGLALLSKVVVQNFSADRPVKDDTAPPRSIVPRSILPIPAELRPRVPVVGQVRPFLQRSTGPQIVGVRPQMQTFLVQLQKLQMMKTMEQEKKKKEGLAGDKPNGSSSGTNVDPTSSFLMLKECQMALTPDEDGDLPIHLAVVQGHMKLIMKFIHLMKSQNKTLDIFNRLRQTPLHLAVITEALEITSLLLANYCNPNIQDRNGQTCVHLAVQRDNTQILHTMVREAKTEVKTGLRNYEGFSPVHIAVQNESKVAIKSLKKLRSNIDCTDGKSGRTPLFHAVESNLYDIAHELLECGADPNIQNYAGYTAAFAANSRGYRQICVLLGLYGAEVPFKMDSIDQTPIKREPGGKVPVVKQETMSRLGKYITSKDKISGGIYVQNVEEEDEGISFDEARSEKGKRLDKKHVKSSQNEVDVKISVSVPQNVMSGGMVSVNKMELKTEPSDSCPPSPISIRTLYSHNGGNVTVSSATQLTPLKMPIFSAMSPMPALMNSPMPTTPMSMSSAAMSPFLPGTQMSPMMGGFQFPITIPTAVAEATPQTPVPSDITSPKPELAERGNSPNKSKQSFMPTVVEDHGSKPLDLTQRGPDGGDDERHSPPRSTAPQNKSQGRKEVVETQENSTKLEGGPAVMPRFIPMQQGGARFPGLTQVWTDGQQMALSPVVYRQPFYMHMQSPVMPVTGGPPVVFPSQGMIMIPSRGSPANTTLTSAQGQQTLTSQATSLEKDSTSGEDVITGTESSDKESSNVKYTEGQKTLPSTRPQRLEIPQYRHIRPQIVPSPLAMTEPLKQMNKTAVSTSADSSGTGHSDVPMKSNVVIKTEPVSPTDSNTIPLEAKTTPSQILQQLNSPVFAPHGGHMMARHPGLPMTIPRPDGSGSPRFPMQWPHWRNRMPMMGPQVMNMPMQPMHSQIQFLQRMPGFPQGCLPQGQGYLAQGHSPQGQEIKTEPGMSSTLKKVRKRKHKEKKGEPPALEDGDKSGETLIARNITSEEGAGTGGGDKRPSIHVKKKRKRKKKHSTGDESKVSDTPKSIFEAQPTFQQGPAQPIYYMPMPTSTAGSDIPSVVGALSEPTLRPMQGQILIAPKPPPMMQVSSGMRFSPAELNVPNVSVPSTVGSFEDSNKRAAVESMKENITNSMVKVTTAASPKPEEVRVTKYSVDDSTTKPDSDLSSGTQEGSESSQKAVTSVTLGDAVTGSLPSSVTIQTIDITTSKEKNKAAKNGTRATKDGAMATNDETKRQEVMSRKSLFNRELNKWVELPSGSKTSSAFIEEYKSRKRNPSPVSAKGETVSGDQLDADLKLVDCDHEKTTSLDDAVIQFSALNKRPEKYSGADDTKLGDGEGDVPAKRVAGKDSGVEIGNLCLGEQRETVSSAEPSIGKETVSSGTKETITSDGKEIVMAAEKETETSGTKRVVPSEEKADAKKAVAGPTVTSGADETISSGTTNSAVSPVVKDVITSVTNDKVEVKKSKRTPMCKTSLEKLQMVIDSVGSGECKEEPPRVLGEEKSGATPELHQEAPGPVLEEEQDKTEETPTPSESKIEKGILRLDSGDSVEIENGSGAKLFESEENTDRCSHPLQTPDDACITPSKPVVVRSGSMGEPPVLLPETEMVLAVKVRQSSELSPIRENPIPPEMEFESPPKLEPETDISVRDLPARDADLFDDGSPSSDDCVILGARPLTPRVLLTPLKGSLEKPPTLEVEAENARNVSKSQNVPLSIKNLDTVFDSHEVLQVSDAQVITPIFLDIHVPSQKGDVVSEKSEKPESAKETVKMTSSSDDIPETDLAQSDAASVELGLSDTGSVQLFRSETASPEREQSDVTSVELEQSDTGSFELSLNDSVVVELVPSETAPVGLTHSVTSSVDLALSDTASVELTQSDTDSPRAAVSSQCPAIESSTSLTPVGATNSNDTDIEQKRTKKEVRAPRNIFDDLKKLSDSPDTSDSERIDKTAKYEPVSNSSGSTVTLTGSLSRSVDSIAETATNEPVAAPSLTSVTLTGSLSSGTGEKSGPTTSGGSVTLTGSLSNSTTVTITNEEQAALGRDSKISDSEEDDNSSFELEMGEVVSVRSKQPAVLARGSSLLENIIDSVGIEKGMPGSDISRQAGSVQNIVSGLLSDPMLASSPVATEDWPSSKPGVLDPQFEISDDSSVELPGIESDGAVLKHVPMAEVLKLKVSLPESGKWRGDSKTETTLKKSVVPESTTRFKSSTPGYIPDLPSWSKDLSIRGAVSNVRTTVNQSDKLEGAPCRSSVPSVLDNLTESEVPQGAPKPPQYGGMIPTVVDD
ncbi:uncharacterized protein LOC135497654 [Lineus longissimus]|uniref:uncharacterized protein LOC135497654 n=1 Tax=Lineus longissimus TaxID=88925 RepID=UPI00315DA3D8